MKTTIHYLQNSISHAPVKTGSQDPQPLNRMFSILLFCFILSVTTKLCSQVHYSSQDPPSAAAKESTQTLVVNNASTCFLPVYFNYRRRQLKYNGIQKMDPFVFLTMCRSINDSIIQGQVARYDAYTHDKQKLGFAALGTGFAVFGLLGGAAANEGRNPQLAVSLVFIGVLAVIALPVIAIYSAVPHNKRKAVLFRDLPVAYNLFVESQRANPDCGALINQ